MSIVQNVSDDDIDTRQVDLFPTPQPGAIRANAIAPLLIPQLIPVPDDENVLGGINQAMLAGAPSQPIGPQGLRTYIDPWQAQQEEDQYRVRARYLDSTRSIIVAEGEVTAVNQRIITWLAGLIDGVCELYIGVFRLSAGAPVDEEDEEQSPRLPVLIKTTFPGGNVRLPALVVSADLQKNGVTKDFFDNDSEGVIGLDVKVPAYTHMRRGDFIVVYWGGIVAASHTVTAQQVGQPVILTITREFIEKAGDAAAMITDYRIWDVVQNASQLSFPLSLNVRTTLNLLPAPLVEQADANGVIDLKGLLGEDVQVLSTSGSAPFAINSTLTLDWHGSSANQSPVNHTQSFQFKSSARSHYFTVPYAFVHLISQGRALVWCTSTLNQQTRESRRVCVSVCGPDLQLPAPHVRDAAGGALPSDTPATVVTVRRIDTAQLRDSVRLYWIGTDRNGKPVLDYITQRTLNTEMVGQDIPFTVEGAYIAPLQHGLLKVYYELYRNGSLLGTSEVQSLFIDDAVTELLPPRVPAAPNDLLIPAVPAIDADAVIAPYPNMRALDHIELDWVAADPARNRHFEVTLAIESVGINVVIPLPGALVEDFLGEKVELVYTVTGIAPRLRRISRRLTLTVASPTPVPDILAVRDRNNALVPDHTRTYSPVVTLSGARGVNSAVQIDDNGVKWTTVPASAQDTWSTPALAIPVGEHRFIAHTPGSLKASAAWTITRLAEHPVEISALIDGNNVSIGNGGSTTSTRVTLKGSATPGEQVQILLNGKVRETVDVDPHGSFVYTLEPLAEYTHRFIARPVPANRPDSSEWVVTVLSQWTDINTDFADFSYDGWQQHVAARCGSIRQWQGAPRFCNFTDCGVPDDAAGCIFYRDVWFIPGDYQFSLIASHIIESYFPGLANPIIGIVDSVDLRPYDRELPKDGVRYDLVLRFTVTAPQWRRLYVVNHQRSSNGNDYVIFEINVKRLSGSRGGIMSTPQTFNELSSVNRPLPAIKLPLPKKR